MSYKEQLQSIEAQMERLKQRKRRIARKRSDQIRRYRTHALCVMGAMIESCFLLGWEEIDMQKLEEIIRGNKDHIRRARTEVLHFDEANERIRNWERERRSRRAKGAQHEEA